MTSVASLAHTDSTNVNYNSISDTDYLTIKLPFARGRGLDSWPEQILHYSNNHNY